MTQKVTRRIIQDEPSNTDLFHGGGHERTAHSLSRAIVKFDEGDSAIGLDGSWGSGKSSVVEMAARKLAEKNSSEKKSFHFFTFDIWKSQGSGFRRSFLEHLIKWAKQTFPKKQTRLKRIERQIQGKTREIETNNHPILDWYGILVVVFLPFLPLYYFWAKKVFDDLNDAGKARDFLSSTPFLMLALFVAATLVIGWFRGRHGKESEEGFKASISRMLLISSKQHQDHKVVQKVREVDPNDYEFHATLREILGTVQSEKDRVIVVIDNIDRLPKKEIKEYWALVRSIFSRTNGESLPDTNTDITAIVPYDRKLIELNVNEVDGEEGETVGKLSRLASRELFSKTFDEVLFVAPPVLSNAREFFADKLEEALPDQVSSDDRFRTYRIFCELLNEEGGTTTPRQIVTFVNDLSSLFEMHEGKFSLPTVAAFLAHQDLLTETPGILNDENGLDSKIVSLAADPNLVENLASMVFNVESELAFQILLDDKIATAIVSSSSEPLVEIATAPGFELRIDDVVLANIDEWISTDEFGVAIQNVSAMFETYEGDAKKHVSTAVLQGLARLKSISIEKDKYEPYLCVFNLAADGELSSVVENVLRAALSGILDLESLGFRAGQDLATFLARTKDALPDDGGVAILKAEMANQTPPNNQNFMFGLASSIADTGFELGDFFDAKIEFAKDSDFLETQIVGNPSYGVAALDQFAACGLLNDDDWLKVANSSLSVLREEDDELENVDELLKLVTISKLQITRERLSEIELEDAIKDGDFFRNIEDGTTEESQIAQANLLFLLQSQMSDGLSVPQTLNVNGQYVSDESEAFEQFKEIYDGLVELDELQVNVVSQCVREGRNTPLWLRFGMANPEHCAAHQINCALLESERPPYISLNTLVAHFSYIAGILGEFELTNLLGKYSQLSKLEDVQKLQLENIPQGLLIATHDVRDGEWSALHQHIQELLQAIEQENWVSLLSANDQTVSVLIEKLASSGCELEGRHFRPSYTRVVLGVLSGEIAIEAEAGYLDKVVAAIDTAYHPEIWRSIREEMTKVTPASLEAGLKLFPDLLSNVAQSGDRIVKQEKDSVVRHMLIPALEGRNREALKIFVDVGYSKLKVFRDAAQDSTQDMLEAAWKSYSNSDEDRAFKRSVSEALFGKRKAKSFLDPTFWLPSRG
eukprot:CAMPEP_0184441406 /NCGR_PEP_ID=MMETSP0738-20130409/756066_1 /TAXON_ID=385413 /ORGANISM="Thalassiosira miniscula, Strain CCMP1093" /LENGTH=1161 /DNA_ID=CAMNT_0026809331 /DNA_START=997 /DNA_END=4482 /DNA_ORIENTATION=-